MDRLCFRHLPGLQDYQLTWQRMRQFTDNRRADTPDEIWLLQHPPLFTLGQAGKIDNLLQAGTVPLVYSDRGGQITYHGPGQLIAYTLLDLKRRQLGVRQLVTQLEQVAIDLLQEFDLDGYSKKSAPGVYIQHQQREHKIAALGLRVRKGCCYHGLAFNVDMDLAPFAQIHPCGQVQLAVTQLKDLLPQQPPWQEVENKLRGQLQKHLD